VDTNYFHPTGDGKADPSVVFTGLMDHPPNIDAVVWFCRKILPALRAKRPGLRFKIVGARPDARVIELAGREGVEVTGEVADIRPYLAGSSALVVPLRSGGGTRLKILEAMAMGRPVISTTLGAEGLEVTPGDNLLIADSAERFAGQILTLLESPDMARRLGKAGRELVVAKYDWQFCLRRLEGLYDRLLSNESRPAPRLAPEEPGPGA
jgi:glycosyltransferase involved in cell wall biosynthesis